ncbi:HAD family hydrolase [Dermatophilus congolensis]|uniref:HAD family hydrolase n=1 Tax=Dermatophilus congolensis TaxID=1863 RepID=UPI00312C814F
MVVSLGVGAARPSLIATDLDGTLLDERGRVSVRTKRALQGVWEAGIRTVFVTARPPRWLVPLEEAVDGHGVVICANGAFVYQVADRQMLWSRGIDCALVVQLASELRSLLPGAGFAAERTTGAYVDEVFAELASGDALAVSAGDGLCVYEHVGPIDEVDGVVGKLLVRAAVLEQPGACEEVVEQIARLVGSRAQVAFSGALGLAEIGPAGVTKASTLAQWCAQEGIFPEQVWAFGDMPNDLPMLEWAGRSFAVANAHPSVRALAHMTVGAHDADGVAEVLESLVR